VVGGDDERRRGDVLQAADVDAEKVQNQPADDAPDELVEARRVSRVRVNEGIERGGDERPVFGTGVLLLWRRVRN
jgi:hypothetical protein